MTLAVRMRSRRGALSLDVDFTAPGRGLTALFGPSGSGKSTIINAIAGMIRPDFGRICLGDDVLFDSERGIDMPIRRRRIGYVFQDGRLFPHMTVRSNLLYGWRRAADRADWMEVDRLIEVLGIRPLLNRRPLALSGGEKQRVALGRALLTQPRLLLMDEPLAALDGQRKAEILPYIERLRDDVGVPLVYVTHAAEEVVRLADLMVLIDQGKMVATGTVIDLMARIDLFPLTGRYEAGAVVDTVVEEHDHANQLSRLIFRGGELIVPRVMLPIGSPLRVRIRSRDVMLALVPPLRTSAHNILKGSVTGVRRDEGPYAEVQMGVGPTKITARITRHSVDRMELEPGRQVYAILKSVSIDRRSLGYSMKPSDI
jgi:molybdate transport system ATP-binding protein